MHSIIGMTIFSVLVMLIRDSVLLVFVLGYSSHLLADSFSGEGIQLLYPGKKMIGLNKYKNRDSFEQSVRTLCVLAIVLAILNILSLL
jgi:inner membrane protein